MSLESRTYMSSGISISYEMSIIMFYICSLFLFGPRYLWVDYPAMLDWILLSDIVCMHASILDLFFLVFVCDCGFWKISFAQCRVWEVSGTERLWGLPLATEPAKTALFQSLGI